MFVDFIMWKTYDVKWYKKTKKTKNKKQKRNILFNYHFSNQSFQILLLAQMVSKNQGQSQEFV